MNKSVFPTRFDFFGLGQVSILSQEAPLRSIASVVWFKLQGEEDQIAAVAFESLPSLAPMNEAESMSVEIANILVTKYANFIAEKTGEAVYVSPPEQIQTEDSRNRHVFTTVRNIIFARNSEDSSNFTTHQYEFVEIGRKIKMCLVLINNNRGNA